MFLIVNVDTSKLIKIYKSERTAKGQLTRMKKSYKYITANLEICTQEHYAKLCEETVIVRNILTGQPVTIRKVDKGGPCDPSTERYWSM